MEIRIDPGTLTSNSLFVEKNQDIYLTKNSTEISVSFIILKFLRVLSFKLNYFSLIFVSSNKTVHPLK